MEGTLMYSVTNALLAVGREVERAQRLHPGMNSAHEAYAVILEELEEFRQQVFRKAAERSPAAMRTELIQTAAMAVRALIDLRLDGGDGDTRANPVS